MTPELRVLGLIAALVGAFAGGSYVTSYVHRAEHNAKLSQQQAAAMVNREQWYEDFVTRERAHAKALASIRITRDRDVDGVRERPERQPDAQRTACQGSSGRELARGDATFLIGFAARAADQQQELKLCYEDLDKAQAFSKACGAGDLLP